MTIEFASLGSGSRGNATLIRTASTCVLLDCGFSVAEACRRAQSLGVNLAELDAVLVTHEHSDHIKGVPALSKKFGTPVYMTPGTALSRDFPPWSDLRYIDNYQPFDVGDLAITPVPVPHDAADPVQFVFAANSTRVGVLTDLGSFNARILDSFGGCHGLLLEANHDVKMLAMGPYPRFLKQRVGGAWGHLNNAQALQFLLELDTSALQMLVLGHISQKNNSEAQVCTAFADVCARFPTLIACQDQGFDWLKVTVADAKQLAGDTF